MSKINRWERVKQSQKPRKIHRCVTGALKKKKERAIINLEQRNSTKKKWGEKVLEKSSGGINIDWTRKKLDKIA